MQSELSHCEDTAMDTVVSSPKIQKSNGTQPGNNVSVNESKRCENQTSKIKFTSVKFIVLHTGNDGLRDVAPSFTSSTCVSVCVLLKLDSLRRP